MQWHQLDHMQTICTSLQTDNHTNTSSVNVYRLDALPDAQPAVPKHRRHCCDLEAVVYVLDLLTVAGDERFFYFVSIHCLCVIKKDSTGGQCGCTNFPVPIQ